MLNHAVGQLGSVSRLANLAIFTIFREGSRAKKSLLASAILISISLNLTYGHQFEAANQSLRSLL